MGIRTPIFLKVVVVHVIIIDQCNQTGRWDEIQVTIIYGRTILVAHYENIPIRIYRKFHLQKLKIFK